MLKKLKMARTEKGYTCKVMAKKLDISISYYSQIENGIRKLDYIMAMKISSIFGLGPDDMFFDDFKKHRIRNRNKQHITVISYFKN
ncbi:MAG: helix-turn-helix transcriptional regulator [Clostridia bacterium]|nr:helix-turn-helix transcriptional regulator [Clostridia bacterium]